MFGYDRTRERLARQGLADPALKLRRAGFGRKPAGCGLLSFTGAANMICSTELELVPGQATA